MLRFSHGGCEQWGRFLIGFDANMQKRAKIHHTEMKKGYFFSHKLGTKKIIPLKELHQNKFCYTEVVCMKTLQES